MIKYQPNPQKILEGLIFLAREMPGKDFHSLLKILFYADKFHLQKYGRPVFGDTYRKMSYGPVGSIAYDILKKNDFLPGNILKKINDSLTVKKEEGIPAVFAQRDPDLDYFSESDLECLREAINECEKMDFNSLTEKVHKEKAWEEAEINSEMDYELFVDENLTDREELIEYMKETAKTVVL